MAIKEIEVQLALGSLPWDDKVRLARNKRTSKKILTILSTDKDWYVRYYVAYNSNTPVKVLTELLNDKTNTVSSRANIHLKNIGNTYINEE